ncbi:MAG: phosphate signaling complex protein PhoU [Thermodesulfobacteriota bacterium]
MPKHLQRELDKIKKTILTLGAMVEERVRMAVQSIESRDEALAQRVIQADHDIDEMEVEIEEECLKILALHQPVAVDLRFIVAVIKINNELESIADQTVNIAQRVMTIARRPAFETVFDFSLMAEKAQAMLKKSLDALVNLDVDLAFKVLLMDDEVDRLRNEAYDQIKKAMAANPDRLGLLINMLLISRHLERLADYTTNIAEEVIYLIEGEIIRHGRSNL